MADPTDLPTSPEGWAAVLAGLAAVIKGAQIALKKAGYWPGGTVEKMMEHSKAENLEHREALKEAFEGAIDKQTIAMERLLERIHRETASTVSAAFLSVGKDVTELAKEVAELKGLVHR